MIIPDKIMSAFYNEIEHTKYGKVTLAVVRRGRHRHFEMDKHITFAEEDGEVQDSTKSPKNVDLLT